MNAGVSFEKKNVKQSQSVTKSGTPARHPLRVPGRGRHTSKCAPTMHSLQFSKETVDTILDDEFVRSRDGGFRRFLVK